MVDNLTLSVGLYLIGGLACALLVFKLGEDELPKGRRSWRLMLFFGLWFLWPLVCTLSIIAHLCIFFHRAVWGEPDA